MDWKKERSLVEIISEGSPYYPALLKEIRDYPRELFYIGNPELLKKKCVSVVGSRNTNQYGRGMAVSLSRTLVRKDVAVVSGMARGIDTCAHRGALDAGGSTIAVLGCGVDICYPEENRKLKADIEKHGIILSEYPPGTQPRKHHFPQRNRIISGLSEITIVVQARNNSGALITAELAAEQGREVCAIPGNIDSQYNMGNNKLIKEGATPIISAGDVTELLGMGTMDEKTAEKLLSASEMKIFSMLMQNGEMTMDEICVMMGKPPAYVAGIVTVMEMKGVVFSALGKIFIAKE